MLKGCRVSGTCVIGLQWGDEAKGKLVDLLTEGKDLVVRYQGGANAGHTVVIGDEVYKLHHIPSGIINDGVLNLISPGVVINPPTILQEIEMLAGRGIDVASRMKISERAHVVMPWHVLEDQMWNRLVTGEDNIGSTLRGIGPCYADKIGRSFAIRIGDMIRDDFADRVRKIVAVKTKVLSAAGSEEVASLDAEKIIAEYSDYAARLKPMVTDTNRIVLDAVDADKAVLFEGAQGSLLDIDHGTFPFVTSSNASGTGISSGSGAPGGFFKRIIGVCKCYATRVGGGPFPTEQENETGEHIRQMGKEFGTTTGRPRRCGWFDAVAVRFTTRLGGVTAIALTMLDVLSELEEIKICTGYELDGETIDWFPSHADDLKKLVPVYETIEGWQQDVTGARTVEDLPEKAIAFCLRLQELIGRPIEFISVGPDRAQTIEVKNLELAKV
ncbi:Adenylosuccinate synthetase [Mariniblastus fucicola]|uniref:Adenylosuccinate synthetase n=1 Tax=Mariniblastus fucicola TaxID=980251 RepID=A0A5B9P9S1_9BACT|nr:Adenylosuccinate synthetase [Mariniblastus fucicola]